MKVLFLPCASQLLYCIQTSNHLFPSLRLSPLMPTANMNLLVPTVQQMGSTSSKWVTLESIQTLLKVLMVVLVKMAMNTMITIMEQAPPVKVSYSGSLSQRKVTGCENKSNALKNSVNFFMKPIQVFKNIITQIITITGDQKQKGIPSKYENQIFQSTDFLENIAILQHKNSFFSLNRCLRLCRIINFVYFYIYFIHFSFVLFLKFCSEKRIIKPVLTLAFNILLQPTNNDDHFLEVMWFDRPQQSFQSFSTSTNKFRLSYHQKHLIPARQKKMPKQSIPVFWRKKRFSQILREKINKLRKVEQFTQILIKGQKGSNSLEINTRKISQALAQYLFFFIIISLNSTTRMCILEEVYLLKNQSNKSETNPQKTQEGIKQSEGQIEQTLEKKQCCQKQSMICPCIEKIIGLPWNERQMQLIQLYYQLSLNNALLDKIDDQVDTANKRLDQLSAQMPEEKIVEKEIENQALFLKFKTPIKVHELSLYRKLFQGYYSREPWNKKCKLILEDISSVFHLFKERNFQFKVRLVSNVDQTVKMVNNNILNICIGVFDKEGNWVSINKAGQSILKGKTEIELINGFAFFEKRLFREISGNVQGGKINMVIYAKPSTVEYQAEGSIEDKIQWDDIYPLFIKNVKVMSRKKKTP